jgi:hypothetical protein
VLREALDAQAVDLHEAVVRDRLEVSRIRPARDQIALLASLQRHVVADRLRRDDDARGVLASVLHVPFEAQRVLPDLGVLRLERLELAR